MTFLNKKNRARPAFSKELTLTFSNSLSPFTLAEFFNSKRKQSADPLGYIKPRSSDDIFDLSKKGQIATVVDDKYKVQALCVAYPFEVTERDTHYSVTEIGTVINCIKGAGLSELTIAALAQKVKAENPDHKIVAKVAMDNNAANSFFNQKMGWNCITNVETIHAFYTSDMGDTARNRKHSDLKNWYEYSDVSDLNDRKKLEELSGENDCAGSILLEI